MGRRKHDASRSDGVKRSDGDPTDVEGDRVAPDAEPEWVEAVRRRLLEWYDQGRRDLPWRADRDAYRILVSEFMLVQTTVAAVIPYYERFLRRFPDVRSLADADEEAVLKAWEGLGYYRRARQLQAAARQVVEMHGGTIPDDTEAFRALPGVGPYIAGAVLSFAFDRPEPIVEANSQRVLARVVALRDDLKLAAARARIWQAAARLVPPVRAGDFNQALMDLGATICTLRQPSCLLCPLASLCRARQLGLQDSIPRVSPKPPPTAVAEACAVVSRQGRILIVQRGPGRLWERLWEFPTVHVAGPDPAGRSFGSSVTLAEGVRRLTGITAELGPPVLTVRYGVTQYRVALEVSRGEAHSGRPEPGPGLIDVRWVEPARLGDYTFSSAGRRILSSVISHSP
jgi:A/G-specific adenine glycosylase